MKWFYLLVTFCTEVASAEAMLRIRPHIVVSPGSEVKLSQLVDGQGLSTELMNKMSAIALSVAPAYGEKQELANANLTSVLRPLIQEERGRTTGKLHVIIPKVVVIDTTKRGLDADL